MNFKRTLEEFNNSRFWNELCVDLPRSEWYNIEIDAQATETVEFGTYRNIYVQGNKIGFLRGGKLISFGAEYTIEPNVVCLWLPLKDEEEARKESAKNIPFVCYVKKEEFTDEFANELFDGEGVYFPTFNTFKELLDVSYLKKEYLY